MSGTLVHDLLAAAATRHPDRPAIVDGERSMSYGALDELANKYARVLSESGVVPGDRVALYLDKSIEAIAAIYGTMKAGAAYVPLDPDAPPARLAGILRDAEPRVLVSSRPRSGAWPALLDSASVGAILCPDASPEDVSAPAGATLATAQDVTAASPAPLESRSDSDSDLAYILYTSGSTGVPKGVMLSHLNAMSFVGWAVDEFGVDEHDRLSSHAPFHFDLSVFDLFAASRAAACVLIVPGQLSLFPVELARWIRDQRITVWYSVPSVLTLLVLRGNLRANYPTALRVVLFAGEVFPTKYLGALMDALPDVRFANLFGPTETNVCTWYEVARWSGEPPFSIPIGKGITGDETVAVGDDGRPVADGKVGELWVTGPTVMQGYWRDERRTAATLTRNPGGLNTYRTGDLVQRDAEGNWIFLGRRDAQIKSRGYRIELGDIEAALHLHPAVVECAVVAIPDELVSNRIKAFVALREEIDADELSRFCGERIPQYMIPEQFEIRNELPRTSTGKVDRQALAALDAKGPT